MSYTVEKYPNEPIIVFTISPDYTPEQHVPLSNAALNEALDAAGEAQYLIHDLLALKWNSLDELVVTANLMGRSEGSPWRHPNLRQIVLVTQDDLTQMAAEGMTSEAFNNMNIALFSTLEDALDHVRSQS